MKFISGIVYLVVAGAIAWTFLTSLIKLSLEPINEKLDRLIELQKLHNEKSSE